MREVRPGIAQNWCRVAARGSEGDGAVRHRIGAGLVQEVVKEMVQGGEGYDAVGGGMAQNWCKVGAKGGAKLVQGGAGLAGA
jgi:hypothetical protein